MVIGLLKENKPGEFRVILTPREVADLCACGHKVLVQHGAGVKAGFEDTDYLNAGAELREDMKEIYSQSEMVVKVKEIMETEYNLLNEGQIIFACLHPAGSRQQVDALLEKKVIGFAAEDSHRHGSPNSEVAGKLGAFIGLNYLLTNNGGRGQLFCPIAGAPGANALVIGAGIVGRGATKVLSSLGVQVTLMDINMGALRKCQEIFPDNVNTAFSNSYNIKNILPRVDIVINCVTWPKHRKDHLITKDMLKDMKKGSVIVDISADVGGAIETYKHTTHQDPTYVIDGITHYGVDNIPAVAPHTTSIAYAASVLGHIKSIANNGIVEACVKNGYLRRSLTVYKGVITHEETSVIQNRPWKTPEEVLGLQGRGDLDPAPPATTVSMK